ncbi:OsmC family protein [Microbacterium sp. NPDC089189]|uniref:OsmC family protein n=1 Tax=Microbacterium sp. NPDC089189 TaxID=3154972 RepID=UPI00341A568D
MSEHHYRLHATWTGDRGAGTSGYRDYDRSVTLSIEGKPDLLASADVPFRGDAERWNPEDMLLGSLSQCHMLSYLHACVTTGVTVLSYEDDATATMTVESTGAGWFTEVVLHPRVVVADASMIEAAEAAHAQAHDWCFIANSVNFPVRHEAQITAAS